MQEKIGAVYDYVMGRCLWQFYSRNWDREDNINTIMAYVARLAVGLDVERDTKIKNSHYADAKILAQQLSERFDWFDALEYKDLVSLCEAVRGKLINIAVVNSLNVERTESNY
jgi:hypothetical protein